MSRLNCVFTSPSAVAVSNATSAHLVQLVAPSNQRLCLQSLSVFGDSNNPTLAGVDVRIYRHSAAGTATASSTPIVLNGASEASRATCNYTFSVAPTNGAVLEYAKFNPQSGFLIIYPLGQEIIVPGGTSIGVHVTNNSGASVNVTCKLGWEE